MKKSLTILALVFAVLTVFMVIRASTVFTDQQLTPADGIGAIDIDAEAAVQRFATALTFPTISNDDRSQFDAAAFTGFHQFIESAYPLVHQNAERTIINGYSLLFHLPGTDPSLQPVLFMSHMDVVPIDEITRSEWTLPPLLVIASPALIMRFMKT